MRSAPWRRRLAGRSGLIWPGGWRRAAARAWLWSSSVPGPPLPGSPDGPEGTRALPLSVCPTGQSGPGKRTGEKAVKIRFNAMAGMLLTGSVVLAGSPKFHHATHSQQGRLIAVLVGAALALQVIVWVLAYVVGGSRKDRQNRQTAAGRRQPAQPVRGSWR